MCFYPEFLRNSSAVCKILCSLSEKSLLCCRCRPRNRHYSLATYILLRGITLLIRVGNKERNRRRHPALHAALALTRMQHGDTLLMCASCEHTPTCQLLQCPGISCACVPTHESKEQYCSNKLLGSTSRCSLSN